MPSESADRKHPNRWLIAADALAKGNVLVCAELAGIQAAKQTGSLIPLCHPLSLTGIAVQCTVEQDAVVARSEVKCADRTGGRDGSADRRQYGPADGVRHVQGR